MLLTFRHTVKKKKIKEQRFSKSSNISESVFLEAMAIITKFSSALENSHAKLLKFENFCEFHAKIMDYVKRQITKLAFQCRNLADCINV